MAFWAISQRPLHKRTLEKALFGLFFLGVSFLMPTWVWAQAALQGFGVINPSQKQNQAFKPSFPVQMQVGASSNFYPIGSTDHSASLDLTLIPTWRFQENWSASVILAGSKELVDLGRFSLDRTDITLNWRGAALNPFFRVGASRGLILPFAGERLPRESLLFGLRAGGRLTFDPTRLG
jgi:hypothetical protein